MSCRLRVREQESLRRPAAERTEPLELFGRFDAFRDRLELECLGQVHDRRDDGAVLGVGSESVDERLVHLEHINRETP